MTRSAVKADFGSLIFMTESSMFAKQPGEKKASNTQSYTVGNMSQRKLTETVRLKCTQMICLFSSGFETR